MKIQNKKEIELSVEDISAILLEYLDRTYNVSGNDKHITWKIARKQIPSQYPSDSYDIHEFDGVKIVVTHE
jgi:hypothetical protein